MAQIKMKYGIDLGTTNSAICRLENGEPIIKKTDTLKDTLPSCVSFSKKKITKVGDSAYNDLRQDRSRATKTWTDNKSNVFVEFKRTMGQDTKYYSSFMEKDYTSEELSAEVLKSLKSFIGDDKINAAVITIPAKFKADQIAATKRAATMAGIEYCELLQEPIAASMAYGLSTESKNGYWLVFDFGGGTFDTALLKVEDGIMKVTDTEGDNYLGGKNLDFAIVDDIIIPYLKENYTIDNILSDDNRREILRNAMKYYAEQTKNQLSFKDSTDVTSQLDEFGQDDEGEDIELDMVISSAQLEPILSPIFQKAINICNELLQRNHLNGNKLDSLILVGGPTHSPILRRMLKEQITPNVDTSVDPMTVVAKGAALFASTQKVEVDTSDIITNDTKITVVLDVDYQSTSVEVLEFVTVRLLPKECKGYIPNTVLVELVRSDNSWSTGKKEINDIGDVIECNLLEGRANSFNILTYDEKGNKLDCFPNELTIIQGASVGDAVLPYNIGIEVYDADKDRNVFVSLKGLEKNQALPATGIRNGLKIRQQLRPGNNTDILRIPMYQGEYASDGSNAIYNDHVFDAEIAGDDVPALIPVNSEIDVTVKVDNSQQMKLEVFFHAIGDSIEKSIEIDSRTAITEYELNRQIISARNKLNSLKKTTGINPSELVKADQLLDDIDKRFMGEKSTDDGRMHLLTDLRKAFREMENVEKIHEWDALEAELKTEFDRTEQANNDLGNEHDDVVEELRSRTEMVIRRKDVKMARSVLREINDAFVKITFLYQLFGFIENANSRFNQIQWRDSVQARRLINQGLQTINDNPSVNALLPICRNIIDLQLSKDIDNSLPELT